MPRQLHTTYAQGLGPNNTNSHPAQQPVRLPALEGAAVAAAAGLDRGAGAAALLVFAAGFFFVCVGLAAAVLAGGGEGGAGSAFADSCFLGSCFVGSAFGIGLDSAAGAATAAALFGRWPPTFRPGACTALSRCNSAYLPVESANSAADCSYWRLAKLAAFCG